MTALDGLSSGGAPLAVQDVGFLRRESPTNPTHWAAALQLDPRHPGDEPVSIEELRRRIANRLHLVPALRWRLLVPPAGLGLPRWIDDATFDLERHVRPGPALQDQAELDEHLGQLLMQRMDRSLPLWDMQLLPPLADGAQLAVCRFHHALADGVYTNHLWGLLFGNREDAWVDDPPAWVPQPPPGLGVRARDAAAVIRARAVPSARRRVRQAFGRQAPAPSWTPRPGSLAGPVGGQRAVQRRAVPTPEVRQVRRALGGVSTNGLYVALVAGGLQRLLDARGEPAPEVPLQALVPRNARKTGEALATPGTNTWSFFVDLPLAERDPIARLRSIDAALAADEGAAGPSGTGGFAWDVTATLVSAKPVYPGGRRVGSVWPTLPLQGRNRLAVGSIVTPDTFTLTFTADADAFPDLQVLADGAMAELDTLARTARGART